MKGLGPLCYFLGIEVASSACGYILFETKCAFDILHSVSLTDEKTIATPFEYNVKLSLDDDTRLDDRTQH